MKLGQTIQHLREESNMRQSELAKELKLGRTTISNYENNYSEPDLDTLIKIANLFGVSTDYLLGISDIRYSLDCVTTKETKVLNYYRRLNDENQDIINGEMVKLYRAQDEKFNNQKNIS